MKWHLTSARYEEIRSTVADLIEDWGISIYPFSVWELVRRMGIRTIRYSEPPEWLRVEVELYWPDAITIYPPDFDPARTVTFYNDRQDREHIRFAVAHELAHLVLMRPGADEDMYEHEADIFANYLLSPAPLVPRDSRLDVEAIHDDFQMSYGCARSAKDRTAKRRRKAALPDGSTGYEDIDLRKKLNLSYLRYANLTHAAGKHDLPALACNTEVFPDYIALSGYPSQYRKTPPRPSGSGSTTRSSTATRACSTRSTTTGKICSSATAAATRA